MFLCLNSQGQITLEHYYPNGATNLNNNGQSIRLINFSSAGYKYVMNNINTISIYNLNHTLYQTISIPTFSPAPSLAGITVEYINDELFNTNSSDIEYLAWYFNSGGSTSYLRVCDEAGNILLSVDSVHVFIDRTIHGWEPLITNTSTGVKMIISQDGNTSSNNGAYVYSLPGILPCHDCTNSTVTSRIENYGNPNNNKLDAYPNPTSGQTTIEYTLPKGINNGDLIIFSLQGTELKHFKITNAFSNVFLSTDDLPAGTYFYQVQAFGYSATKKMIIIK